MLSAVDYFPSSLPTDPSTTLALIIGVSDYSGFSASNDLPGACNDVEQWWTFLTATLNIPARQICVLASPIPGSSSDEWLRALQASGQAAFIGGATRSNIIQATFQLAVMLSGGQHTGVLTWSGHGAITTHSNQAQGAGKVLCPVDVATDADGEVTNVVGLYENLQADVFSHLSSRSLSGQSVDQAYANAMNNLTLILDTCYVEPVGDSARPLLSRALHRGGSLPVPKPPSFLENTASNAFAQMQTRDDYQDGRLLLAAQFSEPAYEIKTGTRYHGAFSWALRTAMEQWTTEPLSAGQPDGPRRLNVTHGNLLFPTRNLLQALSVPQTPVFGGIGMIQDLAVFQQGTARPALGSTAILPDFHRPASQLTGLVDGFTVFSLNIIDPSWSQSLVIVTGENVSGLTIDIKNGTPLISAQPNREYWFQTPGRTDTLMNATTIELRARTACCLSEHYRHATTADKFNATSGQDGYPYLALSFSPQDQGFTLKQSEHIASLEQSKVWSHASPAVKSRITTTASDVPINTAAGLLRSFFKADTSHSNRQIWLVIEAVPLGAHHIIDRIVWYISGQPLVNETVFGTPPSAPDPVCVFSTGDGAGSTIRLTRQDALPAHLSNYQKWAWPL